MTSPSDSINIPSQVPMRSNCIHLPRILSPLHSPHSDPRIRWSRFHRRMAYQGHLLVVTDSYRFERREGKSIVRRIWSYKGGLIEDIWRVDTCNERDG